MPGGATPELEPRRRHAFLRRRRVRRQLRRVEMVEPHEVERRRGVDLHDSVPLGELADEVRRDVVLVHFARWPEPGSLVPECLIRE